MGGRLSLMQASLLVAYAFLLGGGQLLFKLSSMKIDHTASYGSQAVALLSNLPFLLGCALYALLTVAWVWILSFTPLSRAYPFVALAIGVTPFAAAAVFGEPVTVRFIVGLVLVVSGLVVIAF